MAGETQKLNRTERDNRVLGYWGRCMVKGEMKPDRLQEAELNRAPGYKMLPAWQFPKRRRPPHPLPQLALGHGKHSTQQRVCKGAKSDSSAFNQKL